MLCPGNTHCPSSPQVRLTPQSDFPMEAADPKNRLFWLCWQGPEGQQSDEARSKELHVKMWPTHCGARAFTANLHQNLKCERRRKIVDLGHPVLSVRRQCEILNLNLLPADCESAYNLALTKRIDELFLELPFFGSRQLHNILRDEGYLLGHNRVRRLMHKVGLMAIYQRRKTDQPHPQHKTYPYQLRSKTIIKPNQVYYASIIQ